MERMSLQSEEQRLGDTEEYGHSPYGYISFKYMDNFELAQMGLELIQQAIDRDSEDRESELKGQKDEKEVL